MIIQCSPQWSGGITKSCSVLYHIMLVVCLLGMYINEFSNKKKYSYKSDWKCQIGYVHQCNEIIYICIITPECIANERSKREKVGNEKMNTHKLRHERYWFPTWSNVRHAINVAVKWIVIWMIATHISTATLHIFLIVLLLFFIGEKNEKKI